MDYLEHRQKMNQYMKKHREKLKTEGKCTGCGKPLEDLTKVCCYKCRHDKRRIENAKKRASRLERKGLCKRCGKCPPRMGGKFCESCLGDSNERQSNLRKKVIEHYGARCVCCNESNIGFLSIDHKNNDGAEHRRMIKKNCGSGFNGWVIKNNFPDFLQVMCYNCNCGRQLNGGICPHIKTRDQSG